MSVPPLQVCGTVAVAVVGGGPAGLMAADAISAAGLPVTICERLPSVGRKLLMAGRGGLNLTHAEPLADFLARYGEAAPFAAPLVRAFSPERLVAFAHELGQETFTGTSGRVFPRAMKASPLLRAWLARLAARGVRLATAHHWTGMDGEGRLAFQTPAGERRVAARAVVLALGGASWPRLGSDGGWVGTVAGWGVTVHPLVPANCGVEIAWSEHVLRHAGAPLKRIALAVGARSARGEAVVTARGLEGGAVYALTPAIRTALAASGDGRTTLFVDLRPDEPAAALAVRLAAPRGKQSTATFLTRVLGLSPAARVLLHEAAGRDLPRDAAALAALVKAVPLTVHALSGLDRAISSAGGIARDELDGALMLRRRPGVFAAGEMLDWEAPTGGYLLQAAFATGFAAGQGVVAWLNSRSPAATALSATG